MSKWRPLWYVKPGFTGWHVRANIWRRPSKHLPEGYCIDVAAPGGPFGYDEAHALAKALTARGSRSGRLPAEG